MNELQKKTSHKYLYSTGQQSYMSAHCES